MAKKVLKKRKGLDPDAEGLIFIAVAWLLLLSLWSFSFQNIAANWLGYVGYIAALACTYLFGLGAYLVSAYFIWLGVKLLASGQKRTYTPYDHLYALIFTSSICMLLTVAADAFPSWAEQWDRSVVSETTSLFSSYPQNITRYNLGGVPFYFVYSDLPFLNLERILSPAGCVLIFFSLALVSLFLLTRVRIVAAFLLAWKGAVTISRYITEALRKKPTAPIAKTFTGLSVANPKVVVEEPKKKKELVAPKVEALIEKVTPRVMKKTESAIKAPILPKNLIVKNDGRYRLPEPDLLLPAAEKNDLPTLKKELVEQAAVLEETLKSFGIEAKVGEIHSGPTITSFEVHPSIGVKVQKIKALENDIALNMQAKSIRIVAPIPGKAAVGVEVPAIHPQAVNFREMLEFYQRSNRRMQIPILLGKAINGEWIVSDLAKMPHLLIAGATGSGKSVCINTIVMSILMNARPDEIKLLMVDPKKVELTQYSRLPHMIAPVITEPHGAYAALQWLVKEMQVRYEILKQLGLRNITSFNHRKANKEFEATLPIPIPEQMPMIIAMIDEFADLMMVSSADIETPIARIAQMARAVGIHLILATQRPSREVITGIIKANIPTRIAFKVASRINSQIILDDVGAENLLGNGDLLFVPPGTAQLVRAQGAYISDDEINQVIKSLTQYPPQYLIPSFDAFRTLDQAADDNEPKDSLYAEALEIVTASKSASTTFLQRKLKIGYARAASLMDELEQNGIIGPQEGARPRRVLTQTASSSQDAFDDEPDDEPLT
ncbi:MAG: translocase ftsK [Chlamydiota bacterium]|jgi:S-DNA-T family DNA segregation ATPase FtsK/SpoIIIE